MKDTEESLTREWADTTVAMATIAVTPVESAAGKARAAIVTVVDRVFADVRGNQGDGVPFTKADVARVMQSVMAEAAEIIRRRTA